MEGLLLRELSRGRMGKEGSCQDASHRNARGWASGQGPALLVGPGKKTKAGATDGVMSLDL